MNSECLQAITQMLISSKKWILEISCKTWLTKTLSTGYLIQVILRTTSFGYCSLFSVIDSFFNLIFFYHIYPEHLGHRKQDISDRKIWLLFILETRKIKGHTILLMTKRCDASNVLSNGYMPRKINVIHFFFFLQMLNVEMPFIYKQITSNMDMIWIDRDKQYSKLSRVEQNYICLFPSN